MYTKSAAGRQETYNKNFVRYPPKNYKNVQKIRRATNSTHIYTKLFGNFSLSILTHHPEPEPNPDTRRETHASAGLCARLSASAPHLTVDDEERTGSL